MINIIFTSNAPRSGKDTATRLLMSQFSYMHPIKITMAGPLYDAIGSLFGIDPNEWNELYEHEKDIPTTRLKGHSPRTALQWLAEDVMKPTYGVAFFGEIAAQRATQARSGGHELAIVSDGGFIDELNAYVSAVGREDCYVISIIRHGPREDTRSMITGYDLGVPNYVIYNTGTTSELHYSLSSIMVRIMRDRKNA